MRLTWQRQQFVKMLPAVSTWASSLGFGEDIHGPGRLLTRALIPPLGWSRPDYIIQGGNRPSSALDTGAPSYRQETEWQHVSERGFRES